MSNETFNELGDRLKAVEMIKAGELLIPELPTIARLDGRAFHTFTRKFDRPFERYMSAWMDLTTRDLVKEFHASVGYTQSDEITLVWSKPSQFGGRYQKYVSLLAAYCSASFVKHIAGTAHLPDHLLNCKNATPTFDCRVFQVPNKDWVVDVLAWREQDAVKNSVAMAAQSFYSHKELMNKNRAQQMDMLHAKGINWNNYPVHFRRGIYLKNYVAGVMLSESELAAIPEKHRPTGPVLRGSVHLVPEFFDNPIRACENAKEIIFGKEENDGDCVR